MQLYIVQWPMADGNKIIAVCDNEKLAKYCTSFRSDEYRNIGLICCGASYMTIERSQDLHINFDIMCPFTLNFLKISKKRRDLPKVVQNILHTRNELRKAQKIKK